MKNRIEEKIGKFIKETEVGNLVVPELNVDSERKSWLEKGGIKGVEGLPEGVKHGNEQQKLIDIVKKAVNSGKLNPKLGFEFVYSISNAKTSRDLKFTRDSINQSLGMKEGLSESNDSQYQVKKTKTKVSRPAKDDLDNDDVTTTYYSVSLNGKVVGELKYRDDGGYLFGTLNGKKFEIKGQGSDVENRFFKFIQSDRAKGFRVKEGRGMQAAGIFEADEKVTCPRCSGSKTDEGKPCPVCRGTGKLSRLAWEKSYGNPATMHKEAKGEKSIIGKSVSIEMYVGGKLKGHKGKVIRQLSNGQYVVKLEFGQTVNREREELELRESGPIPTTVSRPAEL